MKKSLIVVLDNVRSAHNVGSVFRCCDAFGVDKLWLCGITATPPHRGIEKTALGATESVSWQYEQSTPHLIDTLSRRQPAPRCVAVETSYTAQPLHRFSFREDRFERPLLLVFGHEIKGISEEVLKRCTEGISIPQVGEKNSLNISVSVGIVLWKIFEVFLGNREELTSRGCQTE